MFTPNDNLAKKKDLGKFTTYKHGLLLLLLLLLLLFLETAHRRAQLTWRHMRWTLQSEGRRTNEEQTTHGSNKISKQICKYSFHPGNDLIMIASFFFNVPERIYLIKKA
jgi:hypothetical protein